MDIVSSILSTRPPTFTTFSASGAVENGFSPSPMNSPSVATIGFLNAGFTHGATSNMTYTNGRFVSPGTFGSYELLVKNSVLPTSTADVILSFGPSGQLNVHRINSATASGSEYVLSVTSPSGSARASIYSGLIPSLDYIALTITNESFDLYVNGSTVSVARPLDMETLTNYSPRAAVDKLVYFSVLREYPMPKEYHDDIFDLVSNSFSSLAVEGFYNSTTFVSDPDLLTLKAEFELDEQAQAVYTAEPSDSFTMMPTWSDNGSYDVTIAGTKFAGVDIPVLGTYTEANAPEEAYTNLPGSTLKLLGPAATLVSANMPDRSAVVSAASYFSNSGVLPTLFGSMTVSPDASATVVAEYPTAYSMWVYLSNTSPGTIVSGGAISLSISGGAITRAGMSQIYVDGVAGATSITGGWHNISFIPTTAQNAALSVGSASVAVHSFALLYTASPASYLVAMYNAYNNPPKVVGSETGSIVITEQAPIVYDNKWSIKSVD